MKPIPPTTSPQTKTPKNGYGRDAKFCVSNTRKQDAKSCVSTEPINNIDTKQNVSPETQPNILQNPQPPEKFRNKYRIKSARLQGYDYSSNGAYFITICTANRQHFFGEIVNGNMQLSEMGEIAQRYWQQIPEHFPFVQLGESIVMPNHVHGIIIINKPFPPVETQNFASLQKTTNTFGPQSKNIASIIRGFKIGVTKFARQNTDIYTVWQTRFHDHIIRNEKESEKISEYIKYNPQKWEDDCYF